MKVWLLGLLVIVAMLVALNEPVPKPVVDEEPGASAVCVKLHRCTEADLRAE